jgi:hypothetical protein
VYEKFISRENGADSGSVAAQTPEISSGEYSAGDPPLSLNGRPALLMFYLVFDS